MWHHLASILHHPESRGDWNGKDNESFRFLGDGGLALEP
jgi:hypothetical protein